MTHHKDSNCEMCGKVISGHTLDEARECYYKSRLKTGGD